MSEDRIFSRKSGNQYLDVGRFFDQWALGNAVKAAGGRVFVPGPPVPSDAGWFTFKVTPAHEEDGFYIEVVE